MNTKFTSETDDGTLLYESSNFLGDIPPLKPGRSTPAMFIESFAETDTLLVLLLAYA